jgi:hypothetical protein
MLSKEITAIYFDNYKKAVSTLCGKNAKFLNVKVGGTYSNHCTLKS